MENEFRNIIDRELCMRLANALADINLLSDPEAACDHCMRDWKELSLTQRVSRLRELLEDFLDDDYLVARDQIRLFAPKFSFGYEYIFIPEFVAHRGIDYPKEALEDLKYLTQFSTSEFAIRPFIEKYEDFTMDLMLTWTQDENEHVRRLASEGCRPSLPWGKALKKFQKDPGPIFPILIELMSDTSLYVRKSVANNLNDISKFHPDAVINFCKEYKGKSKESDWIIKRALRSLLKEGRPAALRMFGFGPARNFELKGFELQNKELKIGGNLKFDYEIKNLSKTPQKIRLEYRIHFLRKGDRYNVKTFQIKETELKPNESIVGDKSQHMKQLSTRKLYPGVHYVSLAINGEDVAKQRFMLRDANFFFMHRRINLMF